MILPHKFQHFFLITLRNTQINYLKLSSFFRIFLSINFNIKCVFYELKMKLNFLLEQKRSHFDDEMKEIPFYWGKMVSVLSYYLVIFFFSGVLKSIYHIYIFLSLKESQLVLFYLLLHLFLLIKIRKLFKVDFCKLNLLVRFLLLNLLLFFLWLVTFLRLILIKAQQKVYPLLLVNILLALNLLLNHLFNRSRFVLIKEILKIIIILLLFSLISIFNFLMFALIRVFGFNFLNFLLLELSILFELVFEVIKLLFFLRRVIKITIDTLLARPFHIKSTGLSVFFDVDKRTVIFFTRTPLKVSTHFSSLHINQLIFL